MKSYDPEAGRWHHTADGSLVVDGFQNARKCIKELNITLNEGGLTGSLHEILSIWQFHESRRKQKAEMGGDKSSLPFDFGVLFFDETATRERSSREGVGARK